MTEETAATPRTDAGAWIEDCSRKGEQIEVVRAKLARKLERKVAALTIQRDALNEKLVEEISAKNFYKEKLEAAEAELDAAKRALAEMHVEPAAWQLVDVRGGKCGWVEIYSFDPSDGGYDRKREAADRMNPHDAPHRWQPLFAALAAKSTETKRGLE